MSGQVVNGRAHSPFPRETDLSGRRIDLAGIHAAKDDLSAIIVVGYAVPG